MARAVETRDLRKDYGEVEALKGVDIDIEEGEFYGLLGPNGAGKTTFINILVGLVEKTGGSAKVFGHDVETDYKKARDAIGLAPQESDLDSLFPLRDVLVHKAGYHGVPREDAEERADRLLQKFGIYHKRNVRVRKLSGGMKRRALLARSLINDPDLLILDEPTAGVDVELRHGLWDIMREMNADGRTILLTTHYIEEAERLCENVAILDRGRVRDIDSPESFINRGLDRVRMVLSEGEEDVSTGMEEVEEFWDGDEFVVSGKNIIRKVPRIIDSLTSQGVEIQKLETERSSLEEIFVDLVGDRDE